MFSSFQFPKLKACAAEPVILRPVRTNSRRTMGLKKNSDPNEFPRSSATTLDQENSLAVRSSTDEYPPPYATANHTMRTRDCVGPHSLRVRFCFCAGV